VTTPRRGFAAGAGHLRLPDALLARAAGSGILAAQRVPALAGAAAAGLHHLQDLPLRHAATSARDIALVSLLGLGVLLMAISFGLSEGLAQPAWGGGPNGTGGKSDAESG